VGKYSARADPVPMTILQTRAEAGAILDFIDESVRALQEAGQEPRFVVVGPEAYDALRQAIGQRYGRSAGAFEQYQWLTIVVDPFRGAGVCVLPPPGAVAEGSRAMEV
jgi:hypothetical protein